MFLSIYIIFSPSSYPYYTLIIGNQKIIGATLSGWGWRRNEISFNEIDKEKVLKQKIGKSLGLVTLYSTKGAKIKIIGLDNKEISEILKLSNN